MKKYKKLLSLLVSGVLLFTTACGTTTNSGEAKDESTLKVARLNNAGGEPGTLQPGLAQGTQETWIIDHMFKGLYTKTPEGVAQFAIAQEANVSEDGRVWTFKLRDFTWSTGNKGTANDFVESFLFTLDPASAASHSSGLWIIENGEEFTSGTATREQVGVKAIDDNTLEITLVSPVSYLPDLLTNAFFYPIDSKNASEFSDWHTSPEHFSANGPFTLKEWTPKEQVVITRNDKYYNNDLTKLDEIVFGMVLDKTTEWQMYEQGQIDLVYSPLPDVFEKLTNEGSTEIQSMYDLGTYFTYFNLEEKPFNNVKVRKALAMAINREDITKNILKGGQLPAYTVTPIGVPDETGADYVASVGDTFTENIEEAKVLLAEGLKEEGIDPATWSFVFLYNSDETQKKIAESIQFMWNKNLGINSTLESVELKTMLDRKSEGDFQVVRAGWIGDYVDPMTFLELFTSYSEFNNGHWENEEYDALIKSALANQDPASRMEELRQAEKILMDEMAVMPVYHYAKQIVTKPYLVDVYTPVNKFPNLEFADIVQQ